MILKNNGFTIFLTLVVTSVLFFLVIGSQEIARFSIDLSRSMALETVAFHSADGGLERGLARLRKNFVPQKFSYSSTLGKNRNVVVQVEAVQVGETINLKAIASIIEGNRKVAVHQLERLKVKNQPGREGTGRFMGAS